MASTLTPVYLISGLMTGCGFVAVAWVAFDVKDHTPLVAFNKSREAFFNAASAMF